jgi:ABC-type proline/glycine betaine transport system ATPase subunit
MSKEFKNFFDSIERDLIQEDQLIFRIKSSTDEVIIFVIDEIEATKLRDRLDELLI